MNGILGFADIVLQSEVTDEQRRNLNLLKDSAEALLVVINDILDISKIEAGRLELEHLSASPADIAQSALATVRRTAVDKGISLTADIASDLPAWITTDPTRLRQILLNLLSNAVKFTEQGQVILRAKRDASAPEAKLHFEVADSGIGIPEDIRSRLFENFSQADETITRRFGGTGLGLAICKSLAAALGGEIGVESEIGRGSRFWFTVALRPADPPVAPEPVKAPSAPTALAHVLVADDVKVNRMLVEMILKAGGHEVTLVANGVEALEAVKRENFDLVFMDMEMPEMDGLSATRAIRALPGPQRSTPIIALTANAMADQQALCRAAGMDDYISKPINRALLLEKVAAWTGQRSQPAAG